MIWILVYIGFVVLFISGFLIGVKMHRSKYHGVITMVDVDGRLIYSLELVDDPELLANQDEATFKIIPPSYEKTHSR